MDQLQKILIFFISSLEYQGYTEHYRLATTVETFLKNVSEYKF